MDLATIIGLVGGTTLIVVAVLSGGSALAFINLAGLLIVVGGTFASCFIKFSMRDVINSIKVVMKAFKVKLQPPEDIIQEMVGFARVAKKDGLIALEKVEPADEFACKALRYLADGYEEELIRDMLNRDIRQTIQRHTVGQGVFKGMGESAPAFGMIGTLIGLVQMLSNMSDPKQIGPAMAVALLTTLYGALLANLVFLPLADKLALRSQQEQVNRDIIVEAAIGINRASSPTILEEALKVYLAPKDREKMDTNNKQPAAAKK